MNNTILFKSLNNNCYVYNLSRKTLYCLDQFSYNILECLEKGYDISEINYNDFGINSSHDNLDLFQKKIETYIGKDETAIENHIMTDIQGDIVKFYISNNPQIVFEVTQSCNLNCKYCTYSDYYNCHEVRENKDLNVDAAKLFIKYIFDFCNSVYHVGTKNEIIISYYGGEPLLKFDTIKTLTLFAKQLETEKISFRFIMTTNAVLLHKYVDFLQLYKFGLLLSLDGNQFNHSYRVFKNGKESFPIVFGNIKNLQTRYPEYFNKYVRFNAVLNDRNSVQEITEFITSNFNKQPMISEITLDGVVEKTKIDLLKMTQNKHENLHQSEDYFTLMQQQNIVEIPDFKNAIRFMFNQTNLVYDNYIELYLTRKRIIKPTGTCLPFARKIFITATGKILPCENAPHQYVMGIITKEKIVLDFDQIASQYSLLLKKMESLCNSCYRITNCTQCMYFLDLEESTIRCYGYTNKKDFTDYCIETVTYFENYPETFKKIIHEIALS